MKDDEGGPTTSGEGSMEVRYGAAHFEVGVRAGSIQQAMSLPTERYPEGNVWVRFPIDPDGFFLEDVAAQEEQIEFDDVRKTVA